MSGWSRRRFLALCRDAGLSAASTSLLLGCVTKRMPPPDDEPPVSAAGPLEGELTIFNWSDYIGAETLERFTAETGVRVRYDTYESNEEMLAKLVAGGGGYDLIGPTGYLVAVLREVGMLAPLDHAVLPGWDRLGTEFLASAGDARGRYGMPYQWGVTGLAYREDLVASPPTSWNVFADASLAGRMTMLDDGREVLGAMLQRRSRSINTRDAAELREARDDARAVRPNLRAYVSSPVRGQLISGDIAVAQLWDGDARQAAMEEPRIRFALPREGSLRFTDFLAIPRGAPHRRAAHAFLAYLLRPEIGAEVSRQTGYSPCSDAARRVHGDAAASYTADETARFEPQQDVGPALDTWDRMWTEVKAG